MANFDSIFDTLAFDRWWLPNGVNNIGNLIQVAYELSVAAKLGRAVLSAVAELLVLDSLDRDRNFNVSVLPMKTMASM